MGPRLPASEILDVLETFAKIIDASRTAAIPNTVELRGESTHEIALLGSRHCGRGFARFIGEQVQLLARCARMVYGKDRQIFEARESHPIERVNGVSKLA